jgi:SAM-dependent methyltransferase
MARVHLFEIEDQPWCPAVLRDAGTAYITRFCELTGLMRGAAPRIRALVAAANGRVVDLGSGAGGPARLLLDLVDDDVTVLCTDLFPNRPALEDAARRQPRLSWHPDPVDARDVPPDLHGARTMFNAFHHLRPDDARAVLADAVAKRQPIGIFEFVGRQPHAVPGVFGIPFAVLALVPWLRPFRWSWLPLTYLVPVVPAFIWWDGLVSCLRVYAPDELRALVRGLDDFEWDIGTFPLPFPGYGTYLVGLPRRDLS